MQAAIVNKGRLINVYTGSKQNSVKLRRPTLVIKDLLTDGYMTCQLIASEG